MKISNLRLKLFFIFIFVILLSGIFTIMKKDKDARIELIKHNQMKNMKMLYRFIMHDFKLAADARYEKIKDDQKVIDIFEKASKLSIEKQSGLRIELYNYLKPLFLRLKNIGLTNLHFVFENNRTFLRLHKLKKYGDDLSKYRYTFKFVNDYREPISGYEQGRTKHGFRFVYPIFDKGGCYIGAIDFTFSSLYLQKVLSDSLGIHSNFLIDKEVFGRKAWEDGDVGYNYKVSKENKNYLVALDNNANMEPKYNFQIKIGRKLKKKIERGLRSKKDFSIYIMQKNNASLITFISIKNVKDKKTIAYLVTYTKNKTIYNIINRYRILFGVVFVVLSLMIYFLYRLVIHKNILEEEVEKQVSYIRRLHDNYDKNIVTISVDLNGKIIDASEALCTILGYKKEELIGKTYRTIRFIKTHKGAYKRLVKTISRGDTYKDTLNVAGKDGDMYWFDIVVSVLRDLNNKKIGYSIIGHDVTDKRNLEKLNQTLEERIIQEVKNIREKDKQLLQQSRLAQMGEMISMIAHQWRQPLAAISSTSSAIVLKARLKKLDLDKTVELAKKISEYVQHLSSTIDDFREFFKPNKEKKSVTYADLVDSVLNIVEESIKNRGIRLIKNFGCMCELNTYPNEIKQVVLNLIKNAEDVLLEKKIKDPYIKIETLEEENRAILRVGDNGGGIPEEIFEKIFDPYFSTKIKKDGTGLGLYMSKTIIEEHCGGKLRVFNAEDGAVFEIVLYKD